uniref:Mitochondrial ribosomal protein L20 n=1 Tax=Sus scrofa TaxID=9823 RepID=A0A8D1JU61_PIG
MVFLTVPLWLRSRVTDRYWRVQEVLKHARHFRGRKNRCYRLAVRAVTRAFVKCTRSRRLKKRSLRTLWINRITAASQEHGLKYPAFIINLIKCQVELNRKGGPAPLMGRLTSTALCSGASWEKASPVMIVLLFVSLTCLCVKFIFQ